MSDLKTREERIPARQLNRYLWCLRSDATCENDLPHSGYRHLADKAEVWAEASLAILRAVGDRYHEGLVLWQMGVAAQQQGAEVMAQARWQQAMTILEVMGCSETDQVRQLIAGRSANSDSPAAVRVEPCV